MIKPYELSVDNIVQTLTPPSPVRIPTGTFVRIAEINFDGITAIDPHLKETMHWGYDEIDPIPLRYDILERADFEKTNAQWTVKVRFNNEFVDAFCIYEYDNKFMLRVDPVKLILIRSFHHLQNLFFSMTFDKLTLKGINA